MKTIKLFTLLLGVTMLSSVGSAQETKRDASKCGTAMKFQKPSQEKKKSSTKKSTDTRFSPKAYKNADWTRKIDNDGYERGKIRTH